MGIDVDQEPCVPRHDVLDSLIGPDTVNTLPEATIAAFEDHGVAARTIDVDMADAAEVMGRLADVGIDMDDVGRTLEERGVVSFLDSVEEVRRALEVKARSLSSH